MLVLWLAACAGGGPGEGALSTENLWVEGERYQAFRLLPAGTDPARDTGTEGEGTLHAWTQAGGCADGEGWRMELREGDAWAEGAAAGALHFRLGDGLAICGAEEDGEEQVFDPEVVLWTQGEALVAGEPRSSGGWTSTPTGVSPVVTYHGVFDRGVAFALDGEGADPAGWTLTLAAGGGLVVLETPDRVADLLYAR